MSRREKERLATERAFLEDVCRHRDEDGPRLVFADWLEEQGREGWARFIRLQCERARHKPWERRHHDLLHEERQLLTTAQKALFRYRVVGLSTGSMERGFPSSVSAIRGGLEAFHAGAEKLFTVIPVESAQLSLSDASAPEVAGAPWLLHLSGLTAGRSGAPGPAAIELLAASPHARRLRCLELTHVRPEGLTALCESPLFERLEALDVLSGYGPLGSSFAQAWAAAAGRSRLRQVRLLSVGLTSEDLALLVRSGALRSVERLNLRGNVRIAAAVRALAESPDCAALESLELAAPAGDAGAEALAAAPHLAGLRKLTYRDAGLTGRGLAALAGSRPLSGLRSLDLSVNGLTEVDVLASSSTFRLVELKLTHNKLDDRAVAALAESPNLAGLAELELFFNPFGDEGAFALARSPHLDGLLKLRVMGTRIGERGRAALKQRFGERVQLV